MKTFTSPQTMKCLHTFCKHCLEQHAKRSDVGDAQGLECPRCKQFTALSDVTACTRTEQLLALFERVTTPKVCFRCENESAKWKCNDCDDFYCELCRKYHDKLKKFQSHKWTSASDVEQQCVVEKTIFCCDHTDNQVQFYCFDCETLLCTACLLKDHDSHKREFIKHAASDVKSNIVSKLTAVRQIANERFIRSENLKETRLLVQTFSDRAAEELKAKYEFLKQKLDDDYQTLKEQLQ